MAGISECLSILSVNNIDIDELFTLILSSLSTAEPLIAAARTQLLDNALSLLDALYSHAQSEVFDRRLISLTQDICVLAPDKSIRMVQTIASRCPSAGLNNMITQLAQEIYRKEVEKLSSKPTGLHFNAKSSSEQQVEGFSLHEMGQLMKTHAPHVYEMLGVLLDSRQSPRRAGGFRNPDQNDWGEEVARMVGGGDNTDLDSDSDGEYLPGGEEEELEEDSDDEAHPTDVTPPALGARQEIAAKRTQRTKRVRRVFLMSVLAFSTNQRANAFQSMSGIYLRSTNVPERVVQFCHRSRVSISVTASNTAITSLSEKAVAKIIAVGRTLTAAPGYDNINVHFKASTSDATKSQLVNLTTASLFPMIETQPADLQLLKHLWERSHHNIDVKDPEILRLSFDSLGLATIEGNGFNLLDRFTHVCECWVKNILLQFCKGRGFAHAKALQEDVGTTPGIRLQLPHTKMEQVPMKTMLEDEGTLEGNAAVCKDMLKQMGLQGSEAMEHHVIPLHGDLATLERIDGLQEARKTSPTSLTDKLQHLLPVPGLFHGKMAAAEALMRIYWENKPKTAKEQTAWGYVAEFTRPQDMAKFGSNPGFRRLHEAILNIISAWVVYLWESSVADGDLEAWMRSKPTSDRVNETAQTLVAKWVAGYGDVPEGKDVVLRNHRCMMRDFLLYAELSDAMTTGDIGRVEDILPLWILLWKASRKHKYASYYHRFLLKLRSWPPNLARVIRMNWLCNPTGKPGGFRGIDWVIELNNLYIKVIFSGTGPTKTVDLIRKHSVIIEILRKCHSIFDDNFYNLGRTSKRSAPSVQGLLANVRAVMANHNVSTVQEIREADTTYIDAITVAMGMFQSRTADIEAEPPREVTVEDLGV